MSHTEESDKIKLKTCISCKDEKELSADNFHRKRDAKSGFASRCKECVNNSLRNGMPSKRRVWTEREKDILREYYPSMTSREISEKFLPNRTVNQIQSHATKVLELKKNKVYGERWTDSQIQYLREVYEHESMSTEDMAKKLNKSVKAVYDMASKLEIKRESRRWTKKEREILRKYYPFMTARKISEEFLSNRTANQIQDYATKVMKLNKDRNYRVGWSPKQLNYISENYSDPSVSIEQMSEVLEKSSHTITAMANSKGLERTVVKLFSEEELIILQEHYPHMSNKDLIKKFFPDKTSAQITDQANKMGLRVSEELKKEFAINNLISINNTKKPTAPELTTKKLLSELEINYKFQDFDKYYWVDFYLPYHNLIIEVQGDYFHCHPHKRFNYVALNKNNILTKDKRKNSYFKDNRDIEVLYIWEDDLSTNELLCRKLIKEYIDSRGVLQNYHSFNYELNDNQLVLKNEKTKFNY